MTLKTAANGLGQGIEAIQKHTNVCEHFKETRNPKQKKGHQALDTVFPYFNF